MRRTIVLLFICMCMFLAGFSRAYSHPHLFMDCAFIIDCRGDTVRGIWMDWSFDKVFTAMILEDYDENRDGRFSDREIRDVHDHAFINLENYNFFTYITMDGQRWTPRQVSDFTCTIRDGALVYRFYVPYTIELTRDPTRFTVTTFDETYFTAIEYAEKTVKKTGESAISISYGIAENKSRPYYYDPYGGVNDTVDNSKPGPGLVAAYPEEVVIQLSRR